MKRTQQEIAEEIARLKSMKPFVPKRSLFGDNNHAGVDAALRVMEKDMSQADIDEHFDGGDEGADLHGEATSVREWMDGDGPAPTSDDCWGGLARRGGWKP